MTQPLPNLGAISRKLADANLRIDQVLENLPGALDHLIQAADRKEWNEVARISRVLSKSCQDQSVPLDAPAQEVASAAEEQSETQIKRSLLRLIGDSGRLRRQGNQSGRPASADQNIIQPE
ncbi:MAG: hypothetical protein K8R36_16270 [Planctomycetales bacterium]|nr:hypothetical protein [Planctomycetales bacterium]